MSWPKATTMHLTQFMHQWVQHMKALQRLSGTTPKSGILTRLMGQRFLGFFSVNVFPPSRLNDVHCFDVVGLSWVSPWFFQKTCIPNHAGFLHLLQQQCNHRWLMHWCQTCTCRTRLSYLLPEPLALCWQWFLFLLQEQHTLLPSQIPWHLWCHLHKFHLKLLQPLLPKMWRRSPLCLCKMMRVPCVPRLRFLDLQEVAEHGLPPVFNQKAMRDAAKDDLAQWNAYGDLLQTVKAVGHKGELLPVTVVNLWSLLHASFKMGGFFFQPHERNHEKGWAFQPIQAI